MFTLILDISIISLKYQPRMHRVKNKTSWSVLIQEISLGGMMWPDGNILITFTSLWPVSNQYKLSMISETIIKQVKKKRLVLHKNLHSFRRFSRCLCNLLPVSRVASLLPGMFSVGWSKLAVQGNSMCSWRVNAIFFTDSNLRLRIRKHL